ncbi:MAG: retron system putative HNH endonuclease [Carboxydocellales bacterium]
MKYIIKGVEPAEFVNWKNQANQDWVPSYADLRGHEKNVLHISLLTEQGCLCCYCGQRISDRTESHIEHLIPQSVNKDLELEYTNLFASCHGSNGQHCGHKKDDWYDESKFVTPIEPTCSEHFEYTSAGEIRPNRAHHNFLTAIETIGRLKLDHYSLDRLRKAALEPVIDALDSCSEEELKELMEKIGERDGQGRFTPFCFVIEFFLGKYV